MTRAIIAIILALFLFSPAALATQGLVKKGAAEKKKADDGKDEKKKDDKKKVTQMDRMIRDLKALVTREKAKPEYDKELVKELETIVKVHEKNRKPVTLDDLSEKDRQRLKAEVRKQLEAEFRERGGGRDGGSGD